MKANEFVKKHGWDYSKLFGNGWITFDNDCEERNVSRDEVKKLVESWELVFEHGSVQRAKDYADSKCTAPEIAERLKQAIKDVESCQ